MGNKGSTCLRLKTDDIRHLFGELLECAWSNELDRAKHLVKNVKQEDRRAVSRLRDDAGLTLLFAASRRGHSSFVEFLLEECCADIEQRGMRRNTLHQVTPLYDVAYAGEFEIVKTLITHGANVNAVSETESTPVHAACVNTNIDVVRFLVEHGADINRSDKSGKTCLMDSVGSVELCHFLIQQRALVNAVDDLGNSALHWAIREGSLDLVKLLMEHGADPSICNKNGDDALQSAAVLSDPEVIKYLMQEIKPTPQRCTEVSLLWVGTSLERWNHLFLELCRMFWIVYNQNLFSVNILESAVLGSVKNVDKLLSLMTAFPTMAAAAFPAEQTFLLQMAVNHVYLLCCVALTEEQTSSFRQLIRAMVQTKLRTSDGRNLLHLAVDPASSYVSAKHEGHAELEQISDLPRSDVVECLLTAGVAVNEVDSAGNTPLHIAVFNQPEATPMRKDWEKMVALLLHHGAHIDIANAKREIAADKLPANVDVFKHVNLKCLAARAVRAYQLPYRGMVPDTVADFVDVH